MKTIVVITPTNLKDKFGHSGVVNSICSQLEKENKILWLKPQLTFWGILPRVIPIIYILLLKALGYTISHHPAYSKSYAHYLNKQLRKMDYDCVLGFESLYLSYLKTEKPIIYRTDGVFHSMVNYYIFNVPGHMVRQGDIVEYNTLQKSACVLLPSQWVINEIKRWYPKVNASKLHLIKSGANIPYVSEEPVKKSMPLNHIHLLFIGNDPVRKGIDIAIQCVKILNEKYHKKATLSVIGGQYNYNGLQYINYLGSLDKNKAGDAALFIKSLKEADFLIFPTRAECAGIVTCEAAAYGLPVLAYDTGGVSSYVIDDVNGHTFEMSATGEDFAKYIHELDNRKILNMSLQARNLYKTVYNWDSWGIEANKIIKAI